jgi:DNA repair protein RadA/Sms
MKSSTSFVCQECGYETSQWMGKCPECSTWNSLREFQVKSNIKNQISKTSFGNTRDLKPKTFSEVSQKVGERLFTGFSEMDTVLGGGIVLGSVTLLAGDPGIGKSTLLLQTALNIASSYSKGNRKSSIVNHKSVLYVSGEESEDQIKLRALRLRSGQALKNQENFLMVSASNTDAIVEIISDVKPAFVVIDSIQTMESENLSGLSGSVGQVRYAALQFIRIAKALNIPVILVGHVTKEGMVAGPMVLSHMVDTVLFLEGEKNTGTRILRSLKNRFGPVDEVGVFSMQEGGMAEVKDPESLFLTKSDESSPGSVLISTLEGTRAFLVEIQALVVFSKLPMPRRVASGFDYKRLELLLAVLQKHCHLPVEQMDVFVNVAGGLKISDPACDLGICLAVYSSFKNKPLSKTVGISEVGLLGELRNVSMLDKRIKQATRLGFSKILSAKNFKTLNQVLLSLEKGK